MPLTFKELKEFTVQQLATLKKEYEPMRGKTISIDNAKKMSNMLDKMTKDMLKKLANADIPFISTGASSKLVTKHGMKFTDFKLNMAEAEELQQEACWTGYKQVGFKKSSRTGKRVPNCVPESVAREMKEEDLKEYKDYLEYMCKDAGQARTIARMFANKVGDGEVTASGSQVTVDSAKDVESVHKQVMAKYGDDVRVIADEELEEAMSSRKLDNLFIQKGRMQMAKDKQGEKLTDLEIEKEMKRLGISLAASKEMKENLPVMRGQHVANRMMKSKTMKDFAAKIAKMSSVTPDDLEKILPDYVAGADIRKLFETPMMSMNVQSSEYKQGQQAAKKGIKYIDNPHSDPQKKLNWSGGHNHYRTMNMSEERTYTVVHVKHGKEVIKANGTYDAAKKYAQMKGLKDTSGVDAHLMEEADLTKRQVNMVHKKADDMPKKDFIKRYGKDGDSVRYATATNMVKKQLGIEEEEFNPDLKEFTTITGKGIKYDNEKQGWFDEKGKRVYLGKTDAIKLMRKDLDRKKRTGDWVTPYDLSKEQTEKGDNMNEATYKDKFKAAMKDFGINSLDDLKSDADKKKFFKHVDGMHTAKNEELTPAQKKLPVGLQKAIAKKQGDKKEELDDKDKETIKPIIKQLNKAVKAHGAQAKQLQKDIKDETDLKEYGSMNAQYEMMKKEMMQKMEMMKAETDPEKMEMMKKEMMKEMEDMPEMMKKEMMKKMEMAMKEGFSSDAQRKAAFASGYKEKGKKKKEEVSEMMKPQEMAVNAMAMNAMKMNAMKMPIRAMYKKELHQMKTGDDDMTPDALKLNAMVKDPHKSKEDKPMKDMNAMYMKSDVRADVKNNGGADMSKVKDAPKMQTAMKKITAMYKTEKYLPTKDSSINDAVAQMQVNEMKTVNVRVKELSQMVEKYLLSGGVKGNINLEIAEGKQVLPLKEVRTFVDTYNKHFLTNYKTEELLER